MNTGSLLLASLSLAQGADLLPEGTLQQTFDNGLSVVVVPLQSELVALQVWANVGSRHEVLPGTTGYAHFFEHLMFRGSEAFSAAEREARMLELSAIDNAWTSSDHTCYTTLAPASSLPVLLDLEADRFRALALTPAAVEQESGAVMGEFRKGASSPGQHLSTQLSALAFTTHTYQHTTIGLEEDVFAMASGYAAAQAFYEAHYRPERVTVVIAGGVDPAEAVAAVETRLADWSPPPLEALPIPAEPSQNGTRREHIDWSGSATQPRLSVAWKGPAFSPDSVESAALRVVSLLLSGQTAPLRQELVEETEVAWSVWSGAPRRVDPGLLTVSVRLRDEVSFADIESSVDAAVAALREVSPEALEDAKAWARRDLLLSLDDPSSWASTVGWYAVQGFGTDGVERYLETMMALTPADMQAAIDTWLVSDNKTVVTLSSGGAQ